MKQVERVSRRELNKVRTRAAILKAARARFAKAGFAGATMDEIADAAEVSRATLFNYFPSKAEIVAALVDQLDEDFFQLLDSYRAKDMSTADRIVGVFSESARNLDERRNVVRPLVAISEQSWGEGAGMARLARLTDAFVMLLGGERPADDVRKDVDVRLLAEMLVSTYIGLIHNWRAAEAYPLEQRLTTAGRLIAETITLR